MTGNILVIKLGALGDFIQALGPMAAIRKHHPDSNITLMTTKPYLELAQASGYFDRILIDHRPKFFEISKWMSLRRQLNAEHYVRVYDLQNNDRTSFYLRLFSPQPQWVGVAMGASHRNISPLRTVGLAFGGHKQTLALAGINNVQIDRMEWVKGRDHFEGLGKPYVLLVAGSAASRPEKRWPSKYYVAIANKLIASGFQPVLIGTAAEQETNDTIQAGCPSALNLCGQTDLFDVIALGRNASGAIGNDTGPMHMIAPTGIPTIVLFSGSSNPKRHAPKGHDVITIQKDDLEDLPVESVWKAFTAQHGSPP